MNLDNLLLKKEQFPLTFFPRESKYMTNFNEVTLPPYHPSMQQEGIPYKYVPSLMGAVIDSTLSELEAIAQESGSNLLTQWIAEANKENASRVFVMKKEEEGIYVEGIPFFNTVYVGKKTINPYGADGDQGLRLEGAHPNSFNVPETVKFSSEVMREYEMIEEGESIWKDKRIACNYLFRRHNLETLNSIFYRNLIIALDNETIRKKYTEGKIVQEN